MFVDTSRSRETGTYIEPSGWESVGSPGAQGCGYSHFLPLNPHIPHLDEPRIACDNLSAGIQTCKGYIIQIYNLPNPGKIEYSKGPPAGCGLEPSHTGICRISWIGK